MKSVLRVRNLSETDAFPGKPEAIMDPRQQPNGLSDPLFYVGVALAGAGVMMAFGLAVGAL